MSDPVELFLVLARNFEDLYGLAVEAQREDQPPEMLQILSDQICNGLQLGIATLDQIETVLGAS